ncbi:MAG: NAD(P)-dependent oxidoreductase [Bacteroidales bacterium]|nr:NAD(P)-dependent oxidoreductase [Bacteroidales bacterium]
MNINELSELMPITRVLVTGGAGCIGSEVLKELYQQKKWYDVKVLEQNTPEALPKLKPYRKDFQLILGDINDQEVLRKATEDIDFVIHLATFVPPRANHFPDLTERINVTGTTMLLKAVEKNSPTAFFLYTSSISVYGDRLYNPSISVDDPLLPGDGDVYAQSKIRAEHAISRSHLKWSIFRLATVMGRQSLLNPGLFHIPLDLSLEMVTARDTAFALVEAIYHQAELKGKTFNLSGGENCRVTYREFLTRVLSAMGLKKLNLPDQAFAQKNFHCGNYDDANMLDDILHFQQDTIEDYYQSLESTKTVLTKRLYSFSRGFIKMFMLHKSEPLKFRKKKNTEQYMRFFYSRQPSI